MKVERVVKSSPYSSVCSLTRYPHNVGTGKKTQHQTQCKEDAACCQEFITMTRNTNVRRGRHLLVWPNQSPVILWAELEGTVHSRPQRSVDLKQFCEEQRSKLGWKRLIEVIAAKRKFNQRLNPTIHFLFHLHCSSLSSELNTTCCLSASVGWMKIRRHVTKVCSFLRLGRVQKKHIPYNFFRLLCNSGKYQNKINSNFFGRSKLSKTVSTIHSEAPLH